jgi:hypothetical protein
VCVLLLLFVVVPLKSSVPGDARRVGYMWGMLEMLPDLQHAASEAAPASPLWWIRATGDCADFLYFVCDTLPLLASFGMLPMRKATQVICLASSLPSV